MVILFRRELSLCWPGLRLLARGELPFGRAALSEGAPIGQGRGGPASRGSEKTRIAPLIGLILAERATHRETFMVVERHPTAPFFALP